MEFFFGSDNKRAFLFLISLATCLAVVSFWSINLRTAINGYGPQNYVDRIIMPKNFERDFFEGPRHLDISLPMKYYLIAKNVLGVEPTASIYFFMALQAFTLVGASWFLCLSVLKDKWVASLATLFVVETAFAGFNLSRFGAGFGQLLSIPLYYSFANAFLFLALGFYLRERYLLSSAWLLMTIASHVGIGLSGLIFMTGYGIFHPKLWKRKEVLIGVGLVIVFCVLYLRVIGQRFSVLDNQIPHDAWIKQSRIFSVHWFQDSWKMYGKYFARYFLPIIWLVVFTWLGLVRRKLDSIDKKILAGMVSVMLATGIGLVISMFSTQPFLIKLSLPRTGMLFSLFASIYWVNYLANKLLTRGWWIKIPTLAMLIMMAVEGLVASMGALLPLLILVRDDIDLERVGLVRLEKIGRAITKKWLFAGMMLYVLFLSWGLPRLGLAHWTIAKIFEAWWLVRLWPMMEDKPELSLIKLMVVVTVFVGGVWLSRKLPRKKWLLLSSLALVAVSMDVYFEVKWQSENGKFARDYMEAQIWARDNTNNDALFAPDPSIHFGWRDFSQRSSFGNVREWGYTSIAYLADYKAFVEGRKRLSSFGVNLDLISGREVMEKGSMLNNEIIGKVERVFYTMPDNDVQKLVRTYGIDYFVLNKKKYAAFGGVGFDSLKAEFENDSVVIYRTKLI